MDKAAFEEEIQQLTIFGFDLDINEIKDIARKVQNQRDKYAAKKDIQQKIEMASNINNQIEGHFDKMFERERESFRWWADAIYWIKIKLCWVRL